MELLNAVAKNLERHADALERLAEELSNSRPAEGSASAREWSDQGMEERIRDARREARLARRALQRVEDPQLRHAEPVADGRAAA
jgi:hypothetical protein